MKRLMMIWILMMGAVVLFAESVERVIDGDTFVLTNGTRIRLYGIDTPESDQEYGTEATALLTGFVLSNEVELEIIDTDFYGREVALVYVGDFCVNEELVRAGAAWVYKKYCLQKYETNWLPLQTEASNLTLGLWGGSNVSAPWNFRKM